MLDATTKLFVTNTSRFICPKLDKIAWITMAYHYESWSACFRWTAIFKWLNYTTLAYDYEI